MNVLDEFDIPIAGLKAGIYKFDFTIGLEFFKYFENSELPGGELNLSLLLNKKPQVLEFEFQFNGFLNLVCDRCLEIVKYETEISERLFLRFGDNFEELDDNIIIIPREQSRFNIAQYIYEFVALSIPVKKVHPESADGGSVCNPEMIKKLKELNKREIDIKKESDPRWDKLKNFN